MELNRPGSRRTLIVAAALFAGIFGLRLTVGDSADDGIVFLFAIPTALLAAEHGRRAGLLAASLGVVLIATWATVQSVELPLVGFLTRAVTLLAVGLLVGHFTSERNRERERLITLLSELAHTDQLTGLLNRRGWESALERDLARGARGGFPVVAMMIDIDHFKAYNDTHGHPGGDVLLRCAAAQWKETLRKGDLLARVGGEEFAALILDEPSAEAIAEVADRLRQATPGVESCSIGIATWDRIETAAELLERADAALYMAKAAGRNRSFTAPPRAHPGTTDLPAVVGIAPAV